MVRESSAHACLMNALAVSEFLATFGVLCEANRLSFRELQRAATSLAHSSALAQLYTSLLRCVLLEKASPSLSLSQVRPLFQTILRSFMTIQQAFIFFIHPWRTGW